MRIDDDVRGRTASRDASGRCPAVLGALKMAESYLRDHGIGSARLNAEHILANALGCSRLDLYLRFDQRLEEDDLPGMRDNLRKRARGYPLQYILGGVEFYSLRFEVREGVFIPRFESELLVEAVEEALTGNGVLLFLEMGVGAGVLSGALAAGHPGWRGVAFDISPAAASLAKRNFEILGVGERVSVMTADGFGAIAGEPVFDLLVSNPPYVPSGDIGGLQLEVSVYENRTALDGGDDGLEYYPVIARAGSGLLKPGGMLALEVGDGQGLAVSKVLEGHGYVDISVKQDYNGLDRVVTAYRPSAEGKTDG